MHLSDFKPGLVYEERDDVNGDRIWIVIDVKERNDRNVHLTELELVGMREGKVATVTVPLSVLQHYNILSEGV